MTKLGKQSKRTKVILVLGEFKHEGITTLAATLGVTIQKRSLYGVRPATWRKRIDYISELQQANDLLCVFVYAPTPVLLHSCAPEFESEWDALLLKLAEVDSLLFVFGPNLVRDFRPWDYEEGRAFSADEARRRLEDLRQKGKDFAADRLELSLENHRSAESDSAALEALISKFLEARHVELVPFQKRSDVTVRIDEFLSNLESGAFFRIYVPKGRWQADQLSQLLDLLESYLVQIERREFAIDSQKSEGGTVYIFRGGEEVASTQELEAAVDRMERFLGLCREEPSEALAIVEAAGITGAEADYVIAKYSKKFQRLALDARHELEHRILLLRQELESDVFERVSPQLSTGRESATSSLVLSITGNSAPVNVSLMGGLASQEVEDQVINAGSIVAGDVSYSLQDEALLSLFREYASRVQAIELRSDFDQLKDSSSKAASRQTARQRLQAFLYKVGEKAVEKSAGLGLDALIGYLQSLVG